MANIDFPPGAINGTTYTQNGKTWVYDGTSWSLVANLIPDASTTVSGLVNTSTQSFSGDKKFVNNLDIVGGLGVTGQSIFRNNVEIQSGGLGVTGAANISSTLGVQGSSNITGGLGVTGQSIFRNNVSVQSGGLGVTGQSVFRNNVEIQSGGLGVTGGVTITSSGLVINSGGLGVTGQTVFRNNIEIQSGGLGVTGAVILKSTVQADGVVTINSAAGSTSPSSGALVVSGGVGIGGTVTVNSGLVVGSGTTGLIFTKLVGGNYIAMYSTAITPSSTNYTFITDGQSPNFNGTFGVYFNISNVNKVAVTSTNINILPTTASTSTSTGSLTVVGGVGIGGSAYIGGNLYSNALSITGNTQSTSSTSGALILTGGLGVSGNIYAGSLLSVTGAANLASTVGVAGNLDVFGGLGVTGGVTINGSGLIVNAGGLGVTGASVFRNTVTVQSGGIGITGQSVFRNNVEIQSGGLGVTGGIGVTGGVTITGSGLAVVAGGLGVTGQSVFRNNVEIQSGGLGVTGGITVSSLGIAIQSGGLGVTGQSVFRNNVTIQSGGLGVTGGVSIYSGGIGVSGTAVISSSVSANSLSLTTPLSVPNGGTGLNVIGPSFFIIGIDATQSGFEYVDLSAGTGISISKASNLYTFSTTGGTPGNPVNSIQYNSSGSFAGDSSFLWDTSSKRIDIKNNNAIGIGTTTGFSLQNSTASTVSVQMQFSPALEFIGRAWKTSGSPATDTLVRYLEMTEVTSGSTPTGALTWKSSIHNAANQGPTYTKRAEISTNYGLGIYETTGIYKSSFINSASATTDIYYTLPSSVPTANQVLSVTGISTSSISLSWTTNGTVAIGTTGALAYYPGLGTSVDDATALSYSTSGTHLVITSQTATDIPLRVDGNASSSVNLFQIRKGVTDQVIVNSNGNVSISSSTGSTSSTTGALTVTGGVGVGQSLVASGNLFTSRMIYSGSNTYAKNGFNTGDILLDNGSRDTPGIIFYWGDNKNIGIDVYSGGSGTTSLRIVKELNESGGAELWSIDRRGIVTQTAWDVGEVIASRVYNYSDLNMSATTTVSVNSYVRIANITYTPKSSSSYIWIEFSCVYEIAGAAADDFYANITVNGTEIVYNRQIWINGAGGGTRSGTLFPISGRYTNSSTSGIGITVQAARGSSDDNGTFVGNSVSGYMRIMEIGR